MKCCGVENFRDWANTNFGKTGNVPDSCCKVFTDKCGEGKLNVSNETAATSIYTEGCFAQFETVSFLNVAAAL